MTSPDTISVIICERDNASMRQIVAALPVLGSEFDCHLVRNPRELQAMLEKVKPQMVLTNLSLPDLVIQDVYSQVCQHTPKAKIIAIATNMRPGVLTEAVKNGARDVITRDNLAQLGVTVARELDLLDEYRIHLNNPETREAHDIEPDHVFLDDGIVVGCGSGVAELIGANSIEDVAGTLILDYCEAAYLMDIRDRMKDWAHGKSVDRPLEIPGIAIDGTRLPLHVEMVAIDPTNPEQMVLSVVRGDVELQEKPGESAAKPAPAPEPELEPEADPAAPSTDRPATTPATTLKILNPDDNPWIRKLAHALDNDEFALASQRITALTTDGGEDENGNEPEHIDILIRMYLRLKDEGKEISARTFMQTARQAGMAQDIDKWVIGHACNLLSQHYGQDRHPLFFLRISVESLVGNQIVPWVQQKLSESKAPPGSLSFELPETEIIENLDDALPALKKLQDLGCHLTASHYGSTNKSDMLLDSLPVHYVKLHPNDVASIAENEHAVERIAQVTERMHQRKIATIAPQVERAAQLAALWQCGVDYAQGYYMKQPEIVMTSSYKQRG